MLSENIKSVRTAKGFSQEELASRLNVVRQTISKWEKGLSVPDADLLLALAQALEVPVHVLLGETIAPPKEDEIAVLSGKLEALNQQFARRSAARRHLLQGPLIALCTAVILLFAALCFWGSPYLSWDYSNPETAVVGVLLHAAEWLFVRLGPILLLVAAAALYFMRRRK